MKANFWVGDGHASAFRWCPFAVQLLERPQESMQDAVAYATPGTCPEVQTEIARVTS